MEHISQTCFDAMRSGDSQACAEVYRHYFSFAVFVTHRCGVRDMNRDDILQNAFLRLYQSAGNLQGPHVVGQWLAVTIRNLCFDEFRRQQRMRKKSSELAAEHPLLEQQNFKPDDEELFEGQIYSEAIRALSSTSGGETLREFYLDGLSVQEIAARNREAVGTVTARLSRARKKLREVLLQRLGRNGESA